MSHQLSRPGRASLSLPCQSAGYCDGPRAWRCNRSKTALWWGRFLWLKLKETQSQKSGIKTVGDYSFYGFSQHITLILWILSSLGTIGLVFHSRQLSVCIAVKIERGTDTANPYYFIFLHLWCWECWQRTGGSAHCKSNVSWEEQHLWKIKSTVR